MRILIVDDFEDQRELLAMTLKEAGYRSLVFADSAHEALRQLGIGGGTPENQIDIVLMDLHMPDMNGLEVCRTIKRDFPSTLVLQVSATFVDAADRTRGLDAGADSYLTEPVEPEELVAYVEQERMAAACKQAEKRRLERGRLEVEGGDVAVEVVDRYEGQPP